MKKSEEFNIPTEVAEVANTLVKKGFEAYLIGGCVRDILVKKKPKDWDITTSAKPDQIIETFPKTFYENEYGTVGVVNENATDETTKVVEVTPFRLESTYSNKRHPDSVSFSEHLEDDLQRRDFTINAIALLIQDEKKPRIYKGQIIDIYKGQEDIAAKIIRAVGNPNERFNEDALRMLRAVRLAADLGFMINTETKEAISQNAQHLSQISAERIRDEFVKILMSPNPTFGLSLSHDLGLLKYFLPELEKGIGMKQNQAHAFDVWEHSLRTVQHAASKNQPLEVRLAALLHDLGKTETRRWSDEKRDWTFHGHDVIGSRVTQKILNRLVFPKKTIEDVTKLVRWHMFFSDTDLITLSSVRRLLKNVGQNLIWQLMELRMSDRIGTGRPKESPYRLRKFKSMIEEVMHDPVTVSMLKIDGNKLMNITGIKPGPKIGFILHALLEEVLEDPALNNAAYLEKKAKELATLDEKELQTLGEKGKGAKEQLEEKAVKEIRNKYWVK